MGETAAYSTADPRWALVYDGIPVQPLVRRTLELRLLTAGYEQNKFASHARSRRCAMTRVILNSELRKQQAAESILVRII